MKENERIFTPRFCTVKIEKVFNTKKEAYAEGFKEPTHYHENGYTVLGKSLGVNKMIFAGVKEN